MKFTRQYRKLKNIYLKVAVAACLFVIFVIPFATRFTSPVQAEVSSRMAQGTAGYTVVFNGTPVAVTDSEDAARTALQAVRNRLNEEHGTIVYADTDLEVYADENVTGKLLDETELENVLYNVVSATAFVPDNMAYTVRIDDFMVTVRSEADVIALLESAKNRIAGEAAEGFQVELVDSTSNGMSRRTVNVTTADIAMNEAAKVLATIDGTDTVQVTDETVFEDGVLYVGFAENVEVIETSGNANEVMTVEEALEEITKEKAEKGTYEVVQGDCLTAIADKTNISLDELYALNENLDENSVIMPGDLLTITVPTPEISIVLKEEVTYSEEYQADVVYIDNNGMYQGQQNVVTQGTPGYREVIAVVSSSNRVEYDREIICQTIITEATPTVIERGTLIPPTFINPVSTMQITSDYGYRVHPVSGQVGSFHSGIDLYVPMGTAVKASCGGTVTLAGWNGGYGWCVDISHGNGITTRYGHLSSIEVSVGQTVSQGQRIALSGASGNVTGPHLHFEVLLWGNSQNPKNYLNK